ncbi:Putative membrane-spanning protein, partial [hydrothermal vent metagenome]
MEPLKKPRSDEAEVDTPKRTGTSRVNVRSIALPTEHGGWGFTLEPILLGLLVAP